MLIFEIYMIIVLISFLDGLFHYDESIKKNLFMSFMWPLRLIGFFMLIFGKR